MKNTEQFNNKLDRMKVYQVTDALNCPLGQIKYFELNRNSKIDQDLHYNINIFIQIGAYRTKNILIHTKYLIVQYG